MHNHRMLPQEHASLKHLNTLGIDVQARHYVRINNVQHLHDLLWHKKLRPLPRLILGGGSNMLFLNDFRGIVIPKSINEQPSKKATTLNLSKVVLNINLWFLTKIRDLQIECLDFLAR